MYPLQGVMSVHTRLRPSIKLRLALPRRSEKSLSHSPRSKAPKADRTFIPSQPEAETAHGRRLGLPAASSLHGASPTGVWSVAAAGSVSNPGRDTPKACTSFQPSRSTNEICHGVTPRAPSVALPRAPRTLTLRIWGRGVVGSLRLVV